MRGLRAMALASMALVAAGGVLGGCAAADPGELTPALEGDEAADEARVASWQRFEGAWSVTTGNLQGVVFTDDVQAGGSRSYFADQVVTCIRAPCPAVRIRGTYRATSDYVYLTSGGTTERYSWTLRGETMTLRQGRTIRFVFEKRASYCVQPADCSEQLSPGVRCVGYWTCGQSEANTCQYRCGTPARTCRSNSQCAAGEFCGFTGAGTCGGSGTCARRPEVCTALYNPVCGCDGRTYSNSCAAANAGVNVASNGQCPLGPGECRDNSDCTGGAQYCRKSSCGEEFGTCATITVRCSSVRDPVCGCDGVTYNNACMALSSGQNVASAGACR